MFAIPPDTTEFIPLHSIPPIRFYYGNTVRFNFLLLCSANPQKYLLFQKSAQIMPNNHMDLLGKFIRKKSIFTAI